MAIKVLQNQDVIIEVAKMFLSKDDADLNLNLVYVLIADLLFGQKLYLKYRVINEIRFVMQHQNKIIAAYTKCKIDLFFAWFKIFCHTNFFYLKTVKKNVLSSDKQNSESVMVRYVRINMLKTCMKDVVDKLLQAQFSLITYEKESTSFDK